MTAFLEHNQVSPASVDRVWLYQNCRVQFLLYSSLLIIPPIKVSLTWSWVLLIRIPLRFFHWNLGSLWGEGVRGGEGRGGGGSYINYSNLFTRRGSNQYQAEQYIPGRKKKSSLLLVEGHSVGNYNYS